MGDDCITTTNICDGTLFITRARRATLGSEQFPQPLATDGAGLGLIGVTDALHDRNRCSTIEEPSPRRMNGRVLMHCWEAQANGLE